MSSNERRGDQPGESVSHHLACDLMIDGVNHVVRLSLTAVAKGDYPHLCRSHDLPVRRLAKHLFGQFGQGKASVLRLLKGLPAERLE